MSDQATTITDNTIDYLMSGVGPNGIPTYTGYKNWELMEPEYRSLLLERAERIRLSLVRNRKAKIEA